MRSHLRCLGAALLLLSCTASPAPPIDASGADLPARDAALTELSAVTDVAVIDTPPPAEPVSVTLFERAHVYFTGSDNRRNVDGTARFPELVVGRYARATLTVTLACPSNRCDAWDRVAALSLLEDAPDGGAPTELEFARFMTPYGVGGRWTLDVTPLLPLFRGERRVRAFVDTWVGPGHPQGNGWLVSATLDLEPGTAAQATRAVIPLRWQRLVYGDPARPIAQQLPPQRVEVPAGVGGARAWVVSTGHGQGNRDNCAEFCVRSHTVRFDDTPHEHRLWRDDCAQNPISNQRGNWRPNRAGWCPGDIVTPWIADLGAPSPGAHTVSYDIDDWVNTCRPGATPCAGCVFGTGCAYNDSTHTEPYYRVAAYLLLTD